MAETERRRARQAAYNEEHGITPESVVRAIDDVMSSVYERDYSTSAASSPVEDEVGRFHSQSELDAHLERLQGEMRSAAANLDFEKAASLRE